MKKIGFEIKIDEDLFPTKPVLLPGRVTLQPKIKKIKRDKKIIETHVITILIYDEYEEHPEEIKKDRVEAVTKVINGGMDFEIITPGKIGEILHEFGHVIQTIFDISETYRVSYRLEDIGRAIDRELVEIEKSHEK